MTKKALYIGGSILFLLSLTYVGVFASRNWPVLERLPRPDQARLALAAGLYAMAHPFSAAGWVLGLRAIGQPIPVLSGIKIGLTTQVGKYLPGNVAHYVARAGLASASGVNLASSGIATLLEILAALFAASLVASTAMLLDPAPINALHAALAGTKILSVVPAAAAVAAAVAFLHFAKVPAAALLAAATCLIVNFVFAGLSFLAVASSISETVPSPMSMVGIFAVAWAAGYLVPGAPAGLGIREAIIIAWLGPIIGAGPAIACSLIHRVLSACVDAAAALFGYVWLRSKKLPR